MYSYTKTSPPVSPTSSTTSSPFTRDEHLKHLSRQDSKQDSRLTATSKRKKYLRRLLKFKQMDFEYAFWQMIYLFIAPQKVQKFPWARDDPAFLVLLSFWLVVSSIGFSVVLQIHFIGFLKFIIWVVFVDCIGVGLLIATLLITNKYMISAPPRGQDVEWAYAFDVHLNAFFPLLMILHLFQLVFINALIYRGGIFGLLLGNTLWLIAIFYYIYITFLGYSALPFLKNTRTLLFPLMGVVLIYILSLVFGWNFTTGMCDFYKYRVF
ncbi:hypothetical protein KUTeg_003311 [Tegillarca granosa]|uniref:Unc-50-like protein n=1 Tax=Tegillarca granosa TaxID=220873 RepID=A0ABQ9FPQ1_TEGGR|nr:hypothetical protein KUTeg_024149 [Tegillarca granosa]KAJ8318220.1 hypothetical protein KUTeg_003311 [Tegillarca granosa]